MFFLSIFETKEYLLNSSNIVIEKPVGKSNNKYLNKSKVIESRNADYFMTAISSSCKNLKKHSNISRALFANNST